MGKRLPRPVDPKLEEELEEEDDDWDDPDEAESPPPPPKKPRKSRAKKEEEHDCEWKKKVEALQLELKKKEEEIALSEAEERRLIGDLNQVSAERDSACESFSEALRQLQSVEIEAKKSTPGKLKVFKLANAALELAKYARALEGKEPVPGTYILKVEELVKDMV